MKNGFRIAAVLLAAAFAASFAYAQSDDPCIKNHYILRVPSECTGPAGVPTQAVAGDRWTAIGPDGANVVAVVTDPVDASAAFAGTRGSGVLKSADRGATWVAANSGLPTWNVRALSIDPLTPSTLFAGTDVGVFRTTDGGQNWVAANNGLASPQGIAVKVLSLAAGSPATLYAATAGGLFKTTDGGTSWRFLGSAPIAGPWSIESITVDPTSPATVYVGCTDSLATTVVFKSQDGGTSWQEVWRYIADDVVPLVFSAIDPTSPSRLYLAGGYSLFTSGDGGQSWTEIVLQHPQTFFVTSLAVDPHSSVVYAGTSAGSVFRTTDRGATWEPVTDGPLAPGYAVNVVAAAAGDATTIYVGNGSGIFRSVDAAATWLRPALGVRNVGISRLAVDPLTPATVYAIRPQSIGKTVDGGAHWADLTSDIPDQAILSLLIDPVSPSTLYAAGAGVYKSIDAGAHWGLIMANPPMVYGRGITAIAISPSSPSTLYLGATTKGVMKSTDGGASWAAADGGLTAFQNLIAGLTIDPTNRDILYAVTPVWYHTGTWTEKIEDAKLFKSIDGGASWEQLSPGLSATTITAVTIDPTMPSTLYASYSRRHGIHGFVVEGSRGGVLKSNDGGLSWFQADNGLPGTTVLMVAIDPMESSRLYAATEAGVFVSADGAVSWTPFSAGLSSLEIYDLAIDPTGAVVRAATPAGLFEYRRGLRTPGTVAVIEYYHAGFDHYFITADAREIARLDDGTTPGWTRTGFQFDAYATPHASSAPVCRFFSTAFAPKSSHFYTPFAGECALLKTDSAWMLESADAFDMDLPASDGTCAPRAAPVYRLYNNGQGGAPNHRFTTDAVVRAQMLVQGWVQEGIGADAISMCAPP